MKTLQLNRFANKRFYSLIRFSSWIIAMPGKLRSPPFQLIQISSAFWQSRALYVAVKLEVADAIEDAPVSIKTLADKLDLNEGHLYRLMRMLSTLGIFKEVDCRLFAHTKLSRYLRSTNPKNVNAMILMHNSPEMSLPWFESLEACIYSGETPFEKSHGYTLFEYMNHNRSFDSLFSKAMDSVNALTGDNYLSDFQWSRFDRIIDAGGSKGEKSISLLRKHPHLRALVLDRPQIIDEAFGYWKGKIAPSILQRISFCSGSILEKLPIAESDNDLYLFVAVFHAMSDEDCLKVLANARAAMNGKNATIAIVDIVASEKDIDRATALFDMQMLMGTSGRERTEGEWRNLIAFSDFQLKEIVHLRTFAKILVLQ
ncbi:MAG: acetylserotonin O-methyltransferase [Pseudomonadales bacterium]|nr:acetylserotonin O-methyltransferase [Pseudomonadales bacterium]